MVRTPARWASALVSVPCWACAVCVNIGPVFKGWKFSIRLRFLASLSKSEGLVLQLKLMQGCLGGGVPITPTFPGQPHCVFCLLGPCWHQGLLLPKRPSSVFNIGLD